MTDLTEKGTSVVLGGDQEIEQLPSPIEDQDLQGDSVAEEGK